MARKKWFLGLAGKFFKVADSEDRLEAVDSDPGGEPADNSITNAKLADMAQSTIKGRASGAGTGDPTDMSAAQVKTILGVDQTFTAAEKTKLGHITVTQAVDLDDIETRVNNLDAAVVLKGTWDAAVGTFPGAGAAQAGFSYIVTNAGTVDGVTFNVGDRVIAITDNASIVTYAANWFKADYTDQVLSVNGSTGAVILTTANVADSEDKRYVTEAEKTKLANTSGTNTGDQDLSTLMVKANNLSDVGNAATARSNLAVLSQPQILARQFFGL